MQSRFLPLDGYRIPLTVKPDRQTNSSKRNEAKHAPARPRKPFTPIHDQAQLAYNMEYPPSIRQTAPVTYEEASEAK